MSVQVQKYTLSRLVIYATALITSLLYSLTAVSKEPWQDINVIAQNKEAPRAAFVAYPSIEQARLGDKYASEFFKSLNGTWQFKWSPSPADAPSTFFQQGFDAKNWGTIQVPSVWERQGYGYPVYANIEYPFIAQPFNTPNDEQNHVGSYIKEFTVPASWLDRRTYIQFGAVSSAFTVWLNGKKVGYSQGSRTPAEFDLSDYVQAGRNTLAVQVMRWSDGSWLENQDSWSLSGLFRDVDVYSRPLSQLHDFFASTSLKNDYQDGVLDLSVDVRSYDSDTAFQIDYSIARQGTTLTKGTLNAPTRDQHGRVETKIVLPKVLAWSAESPSLYELQLVLKRGESVLEVVRQKIGFRSVELKHGRLLINGVAIKFRGVNMHEFHPDTGYVVDEATMLQDIRLLKQANFNAVRTSHYPQGSRFYELADQYGLYVVDEANLETHLYRYNEELAPARKPEWAKQMLDRTVRMVERDKNHPSIVMWSPGNETGPGPNITAIYDWTKQRDPSRVFQYADDTHTEGGDFKELYNRPFGKSSDILSAFYPSPWNLEQYAQEYNDKPWVIMEYWHSMGNSLGNGKGFWETINRHSILQGGFIWDWVDQGLREVDDYGREWFGHGGDYGPDGVPSSGNFLHNGLVFPNRKPKPAYWEVKKAHQPVTFAAHNLTAGELMVTNRHHFTNLNQFELHWQVTQDGKVINKGVNGLPDCAAGKSTKVELGSVVPKRLSRGLKRGADRGAEYFLTLHLQRRQPDPLGLLGNDQVYASEQFKLPLQRAYQRVGKAKGAPLKINNSDTQLTLNGDDFSASFNSKTGLLTQYRYQQQSLLNSPLTPNLWRAMTDNDYGFQPHTWDAQWRNAGSNTRLTKFEVNDGASDDNGVHIHTTRQLLGYEQKVLATLSIDYHVAVDGSIRVDTLFERDESVRMPPRVGFTASLPRTFDQLQWLGRGPHENYADRQWSAYVGLYQSTVAAQYTPYLRPQENGYKTDVRWLALTNQNQAGLLVIGADNSANADSVLGGFSALPHSQASYEGEKSLNQQGDDRNKPVMHLNSIAPDENAIFLNIDAIQAGVGGDNSWAKRTHNEFTPRAGTYQFSFVIRGLDGSEKNTSSLVHTVRARSER